MRRDSYDLIAIGAGPAGESATELAAYFGHSCLIVERDQPGGTVTTTGGVPTKTLREAALYFSGFRDREAYGLSMETPPELAMEVIRKRTWEVSETLQRATGAAIAARGVDYLRGTARLGPERTVIVDLTDGSTKKLHAKTILIATGSRPFRPDVFPKGHPGVCDTDTILKRGRPPKSLLVVGGGPVAVEFATIAHALGARVTIVNKGDRLMSGLDGELSSRMTQLMTRWGVTVVNDAATATAQESGDRLTVTLTTGDRLEVDTILLSTGRTPNTGGIGLDVAGVKVDARGKIVVDERYCTSAPGIYAAGDVVGPTLASVAMEQARAAVCHAFDIPFEGIVDPTPVSAVYGIPEVAGAGLTEEQCKERRLDYEVGRADLAVIPRGAIAGRGGFLKLLFLKEGCRIVGAHCLGDIASELVGIGQMAIRCGGTLRTIVNMSMNTPTYSYAYKYAAFDGLRRLHDARSKGDRHDTSESPSENL